MTEMPTMHYGTATVQEYFKRCMVIASCGSITRFQHRCSRFRPGFRLLLESFGILRYLGIQETTERVKVVVFGGTDEVCHVSSRNIGLAFKKIERYYPYYRGRVSEAEAAW
jgi:hypothetical protein